jgi:hypothetical protein
MGKTLKKGEVVDYDRDALNAALNHVDAPEDTSDLAIMIAAPGNLRAGLGGYFSPSSEETKDIVAKYQRRAATTEDTLVHELQHYSDYKNEHSAITQKRLSLRIGSTAAGVGGYGILAADAISIGTQVANNYISTKTGTPLLSPETIAVISTGTMAIALGTVACMPLYFMHESERRARSAAKAYKTGDPILTLSHES